MVWHEDALKHLVHLHPEVVFGPKTQVVNLDTKNTPHGRADVVLVDRDQSLLVCELEQELKAGNIHHTLIEQAWAYARYLFWNASMDNLLGLYHNYYRQYCDPVGRVPALSELLGWEDGVRREYTRKCVIIVAGWNVKHEVYDMAARLAEKQHQTDGMGAFPCEVRVLEVQGSRNGHTGPIELLQCSGAKVFESTVVGDRHHAASVYPTNQHVWAEQLSPRFGQVQKLLPKYMPADLIDGLALLSESRFSEEMTNYLPWGLKAYVRFEAWTCDLNPKVHRPHFQFYVGKRKDINATVCHALARERETIRQQLRCGDADLEVQGVAYPIKQYNVDFSSPEAIAEGFAKFISTVYPIVHDYVW